MTSTRFSVSWRSRSWQLLRGQPSLWGSVSAFVRRSWMSAGATPLANGLRSPVFPSTSMPAGSRFGPRIVSLSQRSPDLNFDCSRYLR